MMTRVQFDLKNWLFLITFATSGTGINLKLSTSPSVTLKLIVEVFVIDYQN